ncbi:MAG: hypothetical protein HKO62_09350 [Gammaproteobacteria bacterium]|nr:hypothetical protein [Gammaproteobacteria bacterium]
MNNSGHDKAPAGGWDAERRRRNVCLLLLLAWPLLLLGLWSLYHVEGPAAEGVGMGGYASGLFATCYGLALYALYALNRAVVQAHAFGAAGSGGRALRIAAILLFIAGAVATLPVMFFVYLGVPYSLPGVLLILLALFSWR